MKILHLIATLDPASGGPVTYARQMAAAQSAHESVFVTLDAPGAPFLEGLGHAVHPTGPRGWGGVTPAFGRRVARLAPSVDVAVIHGLWNWATMGGLAPLLAAGTPWVTFPHGMLDPYFAQGRAANHWAKQAVWSALQGRALSEARTVLFTCAEERRRAVGAFRGHGAYRPRVVAFCAPDLAEVAPDREAFAARAPGLDAPYLLCLGRIHPKKGVDLLIEGFATLGRPDLHLVIAGPDPAGWGMALRAQAARLGVAGRVHWPGMLEGGAKAAAFRGAEAFVLPSHQENFGIAVAEALSVGTPVLISDKVNIWRETGAAGLVGPDTAQGTAATLARFAALSPVARQALRAAARPVYAARFSVAAAAADLEDALREAQR